MNGFVLLRLNHRELAVTS